MVKHFIFSLKSKPLFPCVVCSAERPQEEAWAALWSVGWVTVHQQSNCGRSGKRHNTVRQKDGDKRGVSVTTLRPQQLRGSEIMWNKSSSSLHGNQSQVGRRHGEKTATCFSPTRITVKAYIHKMSNLNSIQSKNHLSSMTGSKFLKLKQREK